MSQDFPGVYLPTSDPNTYESTPLASAGWYDEGQHGGALAALIVGHVEKIPTLTRMEISRVTLELFRVVPLVPLTIEATVVREGKKIQVIKAEVTSESGQLLAMSVVQRLRITDRPTPDQTQTNLELPPPDEVSVRAHAEPWGADSSGNTMFHRDAIEFREIYGGYNTPGPGAIWLRMRKQIISGDDPSPAQRAVVVADFCNGVSRELNDTWLFMNPDLTVHLGRYPAGEWVALETVSHYSSLGRGVAAGTIWDATGWVGRAAQTLFLDVRKG
jgi:hypothetical protein